MSDARDQIADVSYLGRFTHNVDRSHRVKLPAKWRQTGWPSHFLILPWPIAKSNRLLVLTLSRWQQMLTSLKGYSLSNQAAAAGESLISAAATEVALDESGRLSLPPKAASEVGIEREVQFVGRIDKFEVWDSKRYAVVEADYLAHAEEFLNTLHL